MSDAEVRDEYVRRFGAPPVTGIFAVGKDAERVLAPAMRRALNNDREISEEEGDRLDEKLNGKLDSNTYW